MNYLSLSFAAFVLGLLVLRGILPKKWNCQPIILLAGSILFYSLFGLKYWAFLLFTALSTFFCAQILEKHKKNWILFVCIIFNIGIWFSIKVLPWTVQVTNSFLNAIGIPTSFGIRSVIVPIGISYYTLQGISYLADVYAGKTSPETSFWKYLLFLTYFPAIVQGPISRYNELIPELLNKKPLSFEAIRKGLLLTAIGMVKKFVIADRLGIAVNTCFNSYSDLSGVTLYFGAIAYSIQLYADFSGCVDICRGVSRMFHVEMIGNFNRPYLADSVSEFWNRWHISFSRWLKDYVYIPLGGNRKGQARRYFNLFLTFLVSGLWHGAGFSFFMWGALHALYQIVSRCTKSVRKKLSYALRFDEHPVSGRIVRVIITFHLVTLAWIFFRAPSFHVGIEYIVRMITNFRFDNNMFKLGISFAYAAVLLVNICVLLFVDIRTKSQDDAINGVLGLHILIRWGIYLLLILDVILFGVYGKGYEMSGFLYGGF